jgi:hypothetical protein
MSLRNDDELRRAVSSSAPTRMRGNCADCRHRDADPNSLEHAIAGLFVFSSGFGSSVADSRLCWRHDKLVSLRDSCDAFSRAPSESR